MLRLHPSDTHACPNSPTRRHYHRLQAQATDYLLQKAVLPYICVHGCAHFDAIGVLDVRAFQLMNMEGRPEIAQQKRAHMNLGLTMADNANCIGAFQFGPTEWL